MKYVPTYDCGAFLSYIPPVQMFVFVQSYGALSKVKSDYIQRVYISENQYIRGGGGMYVNSNKWSVGECDILQKYNYTNCLKTLSIVKHQG